MNYLLDTHVLLWWLDDNPTLSRNARKVISNTENMIFVSAAVIWEIRIKEALGKLEIPKDFQSVLKEQPFAILDITAEHAHAIGGLPMIHRYPFDRMLVAQTKLEKLTLITRDSHLRKYNVLTLDA